MDIETFPNPAPQRDYVIQHIAEEFTSVCPVTGHPDFGTVVLTYVADEICCELKSYKIYLQGFRHRGIYFEAVTNTLCDDLTALLKPRFLRLETIWKGRGGIRTVCTAEYLREGYAGPMPKPFSE